MRRIQHRAQAAARSSNHWADRAGERGIIGEGINHCDDATPLQEALAAMARRQRIAGAAHRGRPKRGGGGRAPTAWPQGREVAASRPACAAGRASALGEGALAFAPGESQNLHGGALARSWGREVVERARLSKVGCEGNSPTSDRATWPEVVGVCAQEIRLGAR